MTVPLGIIHVPSTRALVLDSTDIVIAMTRMGEDHRWSGRDFLESEAAGTVFAYLMVDAAAGPDSVLHECGGDPALISDLLAAGVDAADSPDWLVAFDFTAVDTFFKGRPDIDPYY